MPGLTMQDIGACCCDGGVVTCGGVGPTLPTTLPWSDGTLGISGTGTYDSGLDAWVGTFDYTYPTSCANYFYDGSPACAGGTIPITYSLQFLAPCCCQIGISFPSDSGSGCPGGDGLTTWSANISCQPYSSPPTFSASGVIVDQASPTTCTLTELLGCPGAPGSGNCAFSVTITWSQ